MNCPKCSGDLRQWVEGPVTHHYCPSCQPGYADPPSKLETLGALGLMVASIVLYPFLWLYLTLRGEKF